MQTPRASTRDGIAIVGLAGRFPGAPDVATFWRNLCDGVESICELDEAHLADAFDPATRAQPNFVRARGLLEDTDLFDNGFFGMHAREAALTDPQHRVLLETCWQALEDAGCDPATSDGGDRHLCRLQHRHVSDAPRSGRRRRDRQVRERLPSRQFSGTLRRRQRFRRNAHRV